MYAKPIGVPITIVLFSVLWVVLTIAGIVVVVQAPAENAGLALGWALIWLALIVFMVVERWTGGKRSA